MNRYQILGVSTFRKMPSRTRYCNILKTIYKVHVKAHFSCVKFCLSVMYVFLQNGLIGSQDTSNTAMIFCDGIRSVLSKRPVLCAAQIDSN